MKTALRFVFVAALLAAAACKYDPDYGDGTLQCEPGGFCPGNLICDVDNVCRRSPLTVDGGADDASAGDGGGADADMTDAPEQDVTPPDTTIVSAPSAISGPSVTFIVDSSEPNSTFRCAVDSTTLQDCSATQVFNGLAAGSHTFRAAARDAAGNEDPTPAEYTWMVDPTALDTTITMGPGATSGPNPQFRFTSTRAGTFECMLEPIETAFTACTSPKAYTGLTERPPPGYTFKVRARDTAGNVDDTPAQQTFLVDTTGPTVNITAPAANSTVGTSVTLTFTTETGATTTCQLDTQATINPCASGRMFTGMTSAMPHTLRVTATDAFGNATTQMVNFTVDDTGPGVTISGNPANGATVNTTSASLTFTPIPSNEPMVTYECKFNTAATFTACTGFNQSGFTEGTQTLQVRARDRFGNIGGTVTHSWTINALNTTIFQIRSTGIAAGTRVRLQGPRVTGKTFNRFWIQEVDGTSTNPPPQQRGITVMPIGFNAGDVMVAPGRSMTVIGTVAEVNGNTTLINASYFPGSLLAPYNSKYVNRDSLLLLSELNEGMYVNMSGRAESACAEYDFCITSCERSTPKIDSIDGVISGQLLIGRDHTFSGIVEGDSASTYSYYVIEADESSDSCL